MKKQKFTVELKKPDDFPNGAYFIVPFKTEEVFGTRAQVKVKVTIDGYPYRGSIVPMGLGGHVMGVKKEIQKAIGKKAGDMVEIILEEDKEQRVVLIPEDFLAQLELNKNAKSKFEKLSYTHKREYVEWINGAKKAETRNRRIKKAIEKLLEIK